ncbi:Hypothetical protein HDN1F_30120 [gamma proteobacterium HdN1]|nr:Hypothetical protein HDN1F_30120 [gamma proteobacterium HdN1]
MPIHTLFVTRFLNPKLAPKVSSKNTSTMKNATSKFFIRTGKLNALLAASIASLLLANAAIAAQEDEFDDEGLQYIEMDEILNEPEQEPVTTSQKKPAKVEEEEFVDVDELIYGTKNSDEIRRLREAEDRLTETPTRQSLESEMQSLKQQVVNVNRDLGNLEEDLLYPANTQINVFVSMDAGPYFKPDGVTLKINNKAVSNHLYTEREVNALMRGAVQRLYIGNLVPGEHELVALVTGTDGKGSEYHRALSLEFNKTDGAKFVELKIQGDQNVQQPTFRFKEWE